MKNNILLVWDRMGDYHRARWKAVQQFFPNKEVYAADLGGSDKLYGWFNTGEVENYFLLSTKPPSRFDFFRIIKFIKILTSRRIKTVCLSGYGRPDYIIFILVARLLNRRVILFAESWYPSNRISDWAKATFLKVTGCRFLVSGQRAYNHFTLQLNISPEKVKIGYSVVDNEHFKGVTNRLSFNPKKRLVCVARFASEKNLSLLIRAFKSSLLPLRGWELILVGGGPLESSLKLECGDATSILFLNWQPYKNLPDLYNSGDIFILPSKFEPWGLVVNEAMAAGLPIILSDSVGCLPDLLVNNKNGWRFQAENELELIDVFNIVSSLSKDELSNMGSASQHIIASYTTSLFAMQLNELIGIE